MFLSCFMKFHDFFGIDFRIDFLSIFDRKWLQNGSQKTWGRNLFGDLFATFSEDRFFDAFWSPFRSLLAPFWRPLAPFGLPLASFWLPFGSLLVPLGELSLAFELNFLIFGISMRIFTYFYIFSMKILCKIIFL